jgi:hypothetical protein
MSYPRSCRPFGVCVVEADSALPSLTRWMPSQQEGSPARGVAIRCGLRLSEVW